MLGIVKTEAQAEWGARIIKTAIVPTWIHLTDVRKTVRMCGIAFAGVFGCIRRIIAGEGAGWTTAIWTAIVGTTWRTVCARGTYANIFWRADWLTPSAVYASFAYRIAIFT
jgi:hypothetical protein